jgi:hypothetical protein
MKPGLSQKGPRLFKIRPATLQSPSVDMLTHFLFGLVGNVVVAAAFRWHRTAPALCAATIKPLAA